MNMYALGKQERAKHDAAELDAMLDELESTRCNVHPLFLFGAVLHAYRVLHGIGEFDTFADAYQFYEGLRDLPPGTYSIPLDAREKLIRKIYVEPSDLNLDDIL